MSKLMHATDHQEVKFDVMLGRAWPIRVLSLVTRKEANAYAESRGYRIDWNTASMIGLKTAEVTMVRH